jgi:uncharacterized protein (DUF1778 family)
MAQDTKTDTIIIRIEPSLKATLQKMAEMEDRKLADFIRVQLKKLIEVSKKRK